MSPLVYEPTDQPGVRRLIQPLVYQYKTRQIIVPTGFETDGTTVPRVFSLFFSSWGECAPASVIHDWLCHISREKQTISRWEADKIFRQAMRSLGLPWWKRLIFSLATFLATCYHSI